jgi:hypothetical protein
LKPETSRRKSWKRKSSKRKMSKHSREKRFSGIYPSASCDASDRLPGQSSEGSALMLDGLGIDVGTMCALLDLGIQESRPICCVYGRVAHALSNNMLAKLTVENPKDRQATRSNIDNIESRKIVIANNRKITISEAALLTHLHLAISSSSASLSGRSTRGLFTSQGVDRVVNAAFHGDIAGPELAAD